jgi:hypothetical protein
MIMKADCSYNQQPHFSISMNGSNIHLVFIHDYFRLSIQTVKVHIHSELIEKWS